MVVAAAALVFFLPSLDLAYQINGLASEDLEARREARARLVAYAREDWVDDTIAEAVRADGHRFDVRVTLAGVLLERERLPRVERLLRQGDLETRAAVLSALRYQPYFETTYGDDPEWGVRETVREWLASEEAADRAKAVQIAMMLEMADVVPILERIVAEPIERDARSAFAAARTAAIAALATFAHCDHLDRVQALARRSPDRDVRRTALRTLAHAAIGEACDEAITPEDVGPLLRDALDDGDKVVRQTALHQIRFHPDWARGIEDRLAGILRSDASGPERRAALEALVATGDEQVFASLPRWFHDADQNVRSAAVDGAFQAAGQQRLGGCLVGVLWREAESLLAFEQALRGLRERAGGRYVGLPDRLVDQITARRTTLNATARQLFDAGAVEGVTRDEVAERAFRWWAGHRGLDEREVGHAVEVRAEFWKAADRRDAAAAERVLDESGLAQPGLWCYERGWLAALGS